MNVLYDLCAKVELQTLYLFLVCLFVCFFFFLFVCCHFLDEINFIIVASKLDVMSVCSAVLFVSFHVVGRLTSIDNSVA